MTQLTPQDFAARAAQLAERVDAPHPDSWMPDKAESGHAPTLIGQLVDFDSYHHPQWGERKIAVLRDAEGKLWSVWLIHTVLADEFARKQPQIGDLLAISYKGVVSKPGQAAYAKYALVVDRVNPDVQWSAPAAADEPQVAQHVERNDAAAPAPVAQQPVHDPDVERALAGDATEVKCQACGLLNGYHSQVCPLRGQTDDIPF